MFIGTTLSPFDLAREALNCDLEIRYHIFLRS